MYQIASFVEIILGLCTSCGIKYQKQNLLIFIEIMQTALCQIRAQFDKEIISCIQN